MLAVFKQFQALVERQTRKKLRCIHTNNGGEYFGSFDEYGNQQGIRHQKKTLKTLKTSVLVEWHSWKDKHNIRLRE